MCKKIIKRKKKVMYICLQNIYAMAKRENIVNLVERQIKCYSVCTRSEYTRER